MSFDRPTDVQVYVEVDIDPGVNFPVDGVDQIKANVAAFINSGGIGETLVYSRVYQPVNAVQG